MHRFLVTAVAFLALAAPTRAESELWSIDPAHTSVQFSIRHMMVSNVRGQFNKLGGTVDYDGKHLDKARVQAEIDAASIDTHIADRDKHLRSADFFDVEKYPQITFQSKKIVPGEGGTFHLIGDLTMHGVTKEVTVDVEGPTSVIKDPHGNERIGASGTTKLNRKDFGIFYNALLEGGGLVVGNDVAITIETELVKKAAPTSGSAGPEKQKGG